jgi:3-dehydroquinate dehydratase-2
MSKNILIINGPNLNLLGTRETKIYGSETLDDVQKMCKTKAKLLSLECDFRQSNDEGEIVNWIHAARGKHSGIIINAGAYTHTSIAIRDALLGVDLPIIEVHISNIFKREEFRHHSYISDIAVGMICGLGVKGYVLALEAIENLIGHDKK